MKKILFVLMNFLFLTSFAFAVTQEESTNAALEKAKQDYKVYLEKLKELSHQYKGITTEIKNVVKEQGVPVWNEATGEIEISKDVNFGSSGSPMKDVNIRETVNEMWVRADLPGLKKESVKATIENNKILHIRGMQDSASQQGPLDRAIELPSAAQDSGVEAKYDSGVLTVKIPKAPVQAAKEISVKVT